MASTSKSPSLSNPTSNSSQTGRTREDVPTLKIKVAEVKKSRISSSHLFLENLFFIQLERQVNEYKTKLDELRRAKATTVVKLEKEYVNATMPGLHLFSSNFQIENFLNRLNRPEKSKSCDKCEGFERIVANERKSHAQLKQIIEQKENSKEQSSKTKSTSCSECEESKQLFDIERENNLQLTQQIQNQMKLNEEERNAKEVSNSQLINNILSLLLRCYNAV